MPSSLRNQLQCLYLMSVPLLLSCLSHFSCFRTSYFGTTILVDLGGEENKCFVGAVSRSEIDRPHATLQPLAPKNRASGAFATFTQHVGRHTNCLGFSSLQATVDCASSSRSVLPRASSLARILPRFRCCFNFSQMFSCSGSFVA